MRRQIVDPKRVYAEHVFGRCSVYLDTNAWSDLSETRTDAARAAYDLALTAQSRGCAVFPLSYPTITELLKRDDNADSRRQTELMDTLSSGVSLRGGTHVRDIEVMCAFDFMTQGVTTTRRSEMFTIIPCYISDTSVEFPDGWTETEADGMLEKLLQNRPGLRFLQQQMRTATFLENHEVTDEKYVREISRKRNDALDWAVDGSGKLSATKLRLEEHTFVFRKYILGNLPRLVGPSGMQMIVRNIENIVRKPGPAALRSVVERMPSTWLSCEMNVHCTLSAKELTEKQDFYDHEHAALAVPYTDAFVTSDGGLLDLLRRVRASDRYDCRLLRGLPALSDFLEKLLST